MKKISITDTLASALSKCKARYLKIMIASKDFNEANEALYGWLYTAVPYPLNIGLLYEFTIDTYGK